MVPYGFEVILCHGQLLMVIAKAVVVVAVVAGIRNAFVAIAGTMAAVACPDAVLSNRDSGRSRCRPRDRNRTVCDTGYRRSSRDRGGGVDVGPTSERNVVAGDVGGIGDKALPRGLNFRLIGGQSRTRIAVRYAL